MIILLETAIEGYLEYFEFEQRGSKSTVSSRFYMLNYFRRYLEEYHQLDDLQEIKINHLRSYLAHLRLDLHYRPISLYGAITDLRALYKFAVSRGFVPVDLARRIKRPHVEKKEIEHFTWEEVEAIFLAVPQGPAYLRDLCILLIFYYCGLRLSELRALKLSDFSENFTELYVEMSKGDKARLLPVHPFLRRVLPLYFREREKAIAAAAVALPPPPSPPPPPSSSSQSPQSSLQSPPPSLPPPSFSLSPPPSSSSPAFPFPSPFLFPGRGDGPLSKYRIYEIVKHCGELAGVQKRVTPHKFRHTFATHLHQKGVDINRLAELLGHSNIEKTAVYTHTEYGELAAAVLKLKEGRVVWMIENKGILED